MALLGNGVIFLMGTLATGATLVSQTGLNIMMQSSTTTSGNLSATVTVYNIGNIIAQTNATTGGNLSATGTIGPSVTVNTVNTISNQPNFKY